jgi:hypothetical protein
VAEAVPFQSSAFFRSLLKPVEQVAEHGEKEVRKTSLQGAMDRLIYPYQPLLVLPVFCTDQERKRPKQPDICSLSRRGEEMAAPQELPIHKPLKPRPQ